MNPSTIRHAAELAKTDPNAAYDLLDKTAASGVALGLRKALAKLSKQIEENIQREASRLPVRLQYEPFAEVKATATGLQIALSVGFPETGSAYQDMPGWEKLPEVAEAAAKNVIGLTLGYGVKPHQTASDPIMWTGVLQLKL